MLSEIVSFLVFAVSLIGLLGFLIAIMTSPPAYRAESESEDRRKPY